jgi:hypothetical protein
MRSLPVEVAADDAVELLEALDFIAGLCGAQAAPLDDALAHFVGYGYNAAALHREIRDLAVRLAECIGCHDEMAEDRS